MGDVQDRFASNTDKKDAWNILDLKCPLPETVGISPKFAQTPNCALLYRIKSEVTSTGQHSAKRPVTKVTEFPRWRDVERCNLLAEPGARIGHH